MRRPNFGHVWGSSHRSSAIHDNGVDDRWQPVVDFALCAANGPVSGAVANLAADTRDYPRPLHWRVRHTNEGSSPPCSRHAAAIDRRHVARPLIWRLGFAPHRNLAHRAVVTGVVAEGPWPITWTTTSPSLAQAKCGCFEGSVKRLPAGNPFILLSSNCSP